MSHLERQLLAQVRDAGLPEPVPQYRFAAHAVGGPGRGVWGALRDDANVPKRLRTEAQARRVAWRIVKTWVQAQMAIIEAGLAELAEVFLPYAVNPQTGQTLFQEFQATDLLESGINGGME